ncbi:MAG: ABC transporter ATP-binding protein, partial [Propionibacteriaceae bacterium]|nr:ABC transporter ATP-binding protein [Propionibacteriaceae bacterium]
MSQNDSPKAATPRGANQRSQANVIARQARGGRHGGGFGPGGGRVAEKALNFGPSLKRLLREMLPQKVFLTFVILIGAVGVVFNVLSPKFMIQPTNAIFSGAISYMMHTSTQSGPLMTAICQADPNMTKDDLISGIKALQDPTTLQTLGQAAQTMTADQFTAAAQQASPVFAALWLAALQATPGLTPAQFVQEMAASGQNAQTGSTDMTQLTSMIAGMDHFAPCGYGDNKYIDFGFVGKWLLLIVGMYVLASILMFLQGFLLARIVQRTVYRLREQVSQKLDRLPLQYFDGQPRGEILSRVTNDMDNIQQSLQQTISQLLNSVLTVIGVAVMMFTVSWQLALITLIIVPVAGLTTMVIGKRSQPRFVRMWSATGELNGQVEEGYTGHAIIKVFGRRQQADAEFKKTNDDLFDAAFKSSFLSNILMPINMFIGNLNYVVIAVLGAL